MTKACKIWRSTAKGRHQNYYNVTPAGAEILIGYITRVDGPLGAAYAAAQVTDDNVRNLGQCGGGTLADSIARARTMVGAACAKAEG